MRFVINNRTRSGKLVKMYGIIEKVDYRSIFLLKNSDNIIKLCGKCKNLNMKLSCPPFSTVLQYDDIRHTDITVLYLFFTIRNLMRISRNPLIVMSLFTSYQKRVRKHLRKLLPNYEMLLPGSCELCQSCLVKKGLPCPKEGQVVLSPESVGIDCSKTTQEILNVPTMWWRKGLVRPLYFYMMSVICGKVDENAVLQGLGERFGCVKVGDSDFDPIEKLWKKARQMNIPDWVSYALRS